MPETELSDRTDRLVRLFHSGLKEDSLQAFSRHSLGLAGNREILSTFNGQVIALGVTNEAARFHPDVRICIPEGIPNQVDVPFGQDRDLSKCAQNIKAAIQPETKSAARSDKSLDILISIGRSDMMRSDYEIIVYSDGWHAYVCAGGDKGARHLSRPSENSNPIGALAAASFASADAFRRMLELLGAQDRRIKKRYTDLSLSTLDYSANDLMSSANPALPKEMSLGRVSLIGAGAVGNGLVFALFLLNSWLRGQIDIVDYQNYAPTDLNRCLMITASQVPGAKATEIIVPFRNLPNPRIQLAGYVDKYENSDLRKQKLELVVSTVDEDPPRFAIQSDLPRVLLHGATGEHVCTISRHDFLNGACLGCLFYEKTDSLSMRVSKETGLDVQRVQRLLSDAVVAEEDVTRIAAKTGLRVERLGAFVGKPFLELYAKEVCGVITARVGEEEIAASASFISALAGTLLAGELLKERESSLAPWRLNNHLSMSMFNPSSRWLHERPKDERCPCFCSSEIMVEAYKEKWQNSAS